MTHHATIIIREYYGKVSMKELSKLSNTPEYRIYEHLREVGRISPLDNDYQTPVSRQTGGVFNVDEFKCWVTGER